MSAILNARTLLAGAASAVFIALAMSGSANASATSKLAQCKAHTRDGAVSCCQEVVRTRGVPVWLESRSNCNKAVACGKYSNEYWCYVTTVFKKPKGDDNNTIGGGKNYNTKPF